MAKRFGRNQKRHLLSVIEEQRQVIADLRLHYIDAARTVEKQQRQMMTGERRLLSMLGPMGEQLEKMVEYAEANDPLNPHAEWARVLLDEIKGRQQGEQRLEDINRRRFGNASDL